LQWDYAETNYAPLNTNLTTAAAAEKTIPDLVEKRFTPSEFRDYVKGVDFSGWQPKFTVVGNTGAPSLAQFDAWGEVARNSWPHNLGTYFANLSHSGMYHLIIEDKGIWVMNPLSRRGVCSSSFNENAICIEIVGNYEIGGDDFITGNGAKVRANAIEALATSTSS
jgi:N-acetylmuramoyl-L-alanine amidase